MGQLLGKLGLARRGHTFYALRHTFETIGGEFATKWRWMPLWDTHATIWPACTASGSAMIVCRRLLSTCDTGFWKSRLSGRAVAGARIEEPVVFWRLLLDSVTAWCFSSPLKKGTGSELMAQLPRKTMVVRCLSPFFNGLLAGRLAGISLRTWRFCGILGEPRFSSNLKATH